MYEKTTLGFPPPDGRRMIDSHFALMHRSDVTLIYCPKAIILELTSTTSYSPVSVGRRTSHRRYPLPSLVPLLIDPPESRRRFLPFSSLPRVRQLHLGATKLLTAVHGKVIWIYDGQKQAMGRIYPLKIDAAW